MAPSSLSVGMDRRGGYFIGVVLDCSLQIERLLGMGYQVGYVIGVFGDRKVKPPVVVDAGLPAVVGLIVLLGVQGRVAQVAREKIDLL